MNATKEKTNKLSWHTEQRKVSDLIPNENNPRKMSEKQAEELKKSLETFNLAEIPAINTDNKIVAGHMRVATLQLLGRGDETIDVRVPNRKLTDKEYKEYLLRSNQNRGDWDWDLLANNFDINELIGAGFDEELSFMFDDVMTLSEDGFDVEKALKEIAVPETQPGEIVKLGNHVLMCGDSTKPENVAKLMGGSKTSFIFSDPPYNIGLDYSKGISTQGKYKGAFTASKDKKSSPDYRAFIDAAVKNALDVSTKDAHVFFWCDENFVGKMQEIFEANSITNRRTCLWIKNNFNMTPQVAFNKVYEPCVYGTVGKPSLRKELKNLNEIMNQNVESGNQVVDEIAEMINVWLVKRDNAQEYEHPTQKPITLCEKPMKRCTKAGDIVLDLFGGSGSTLIAAEQLNRRAYIMEVDPVFCDVIKRRYDEFIKR
jgi:DNA modification methylase